MGDTMAVREMKQGLRDMQERMELQNAQLREAVKQLHDIASTQTREASNHTSMGLLLANTAAEQTAKERSIRDELTSIKDMIRDRLGDGEGGNVRSRSSSSSSTDDAAKKTGTSGGLSTNATSSSLDQSGETKSEGVKGGDEDVKKKEKEEKEEKE